MSSIDVEDAYFQAWGKVGGAGRLRRAFSLYADIRRMLEFQIRDESRSPSTANGIIAAGHVHQFPMCVAAAPSGTMRLTVRYCAP